MLTPLILIVVFIITFSTYFVAFKNLVEKNGGEVEDADKVLKIVVEKFFPFMIPIGMILASGLYCITVVRDRQMGLRYLLNFAGMMSSSYYLGLLMADLVIFAITCILLVVLSNIFALKEFNEHVYEILPVLLIFGLPFIALNQLIGFLFDNSESAFKH